MHSCFINHKYDWSFNLFQLVFLFSIFTFTSPPPTQVQSLQLFWQSTLSVLPPPATWRWPAARWAETSAEPSDASTKAVTRKQRIKLRSRTLGLLSTSTCWMKPSSVTIATLSAPLQATQQFRSSAQVKLVIKSITERFLFQTWTVLVINKCSWSQPSQNNSISTKIFSYLQDETYNIFFYLWFFFFFFPTGTRRHYFPFVITGILVMIAVIAVACYFGKRGKSESYAP